MRRVIALVLLLCANVSAQSQLTIVVLEGEGAVNIVQQKTAVRALVEVRDQNNLPVPGASVTFVIAQKSGAAAAQTVTVTTNAAGQATLAGASPAATGGLQISVNATFNGVTASTSITQSVVTAVAASAAGGAGAGAAGAGATGAGAGAAGAAAGAAGGGLSTAAVAGIVGGVAAVGGGVAAAGGGGGGGGNTTGTAGPPPTSVTPTGPPTPSSPTPPPNPSGPPCRFLVSPTDVLVPNEGGVIGIAILMEPDPCANPNWVVDVGNASSWIAVDQRSGVRHGGVQVTVAPYTPTPGTINRVATINVAGTSVLISQPCRCPAFAALPPGVTPR